MEGVFIALGDSAEEIKIERSGPMSIIENSRDGGFRYLTLSPIQVSAVQIEKEIFAAEEDLLRGAENGEAGETAPGAKKQVFLYPSPYLIKDVASGNTQSSAALLMFVGPKSRLMFRTSGSVTLVRLKKPCVLVTMGIL